MNGFTFSGQPTVGLQYAGEVIALRAAVIQSGRDDAQNVDRSMLG
jgi:hypothetical protein